MMSGLLLLLLQLRRGLGVVPWVFVLLLMKMTMMGGFVGVSGCSPHAQRQLAQCLKPVLPFLHQPNVQPSYFVCSTIKTFIRCVRKKQRECGESMRRRNVFKIANDLKVKFCDPAALATTLATPTTTTPPPPSVHELFDRCRQQFKANSHHSLREACRAAYTFVECGQAVLWSHDFSLETFQLHAELMRNRAVFWQHCRRRTLLRGGVGRGLCPYDVTVKLASCLNITYWETVVPGDVKTFCSVAVEIVPCLGELANGCHHVAALQGIADFMWSSFQMLSTQCGHLRAQQASLLYEYGDYEDNVLKDTSPPRLGEPTTASKASYQKPATPSAHSPHPAKPASKHSPKLDADQMESSEEALRRAGQKAIKQKPDSAEAEQKAKVVGHKLDRSEAQKAAGGSAKDGERRRVLLPSSDVQDPTTSLPGKAAGKPDPEPDEPDCIDNDEIESAEMEGKEGVQNKQACNSSHHHRNQTKQADVDSETVKPPSKKPPEDKSPGKEPASEAKKQLQISSPPDSKQSTPPADPKLTLHTLPDQSTSALLFTTTANLLITGTPARSAEEQTQPDKHVQEWRSSPQTPVQATATPSFPVTSQEAGNLTGGHGDVMEPAKDFSTQSNRLVESEGEGKGGERKEKELEIELLGMKTTAASRVLIQTPTKVSVSDSSLPTAYSQEQENQGTTTMSSQTEEERIADAHKVTTQSSSTSSYEIQPSTGERQSMAISNPETTTTNVTFQEGADNKTQQESEVSDSGEESEEKEQKVKTAKLENGISPEMLTASLLSAESNQNSNRTVVDKNEESEYSLINNMSQNAHSYQMSNSTLEDVGQSTLPTTNQSTSEPATVSAAEILESTTPTLRQDHVSTESGDHEQKPATELTPTEHPTNDSESEQRQEMDWSRLRHNASEFSATEASPLFDRNNESSSLERVNLTLPEKNDSVIQRKPSVKPQELNQQSVTEGQDLSERKKTKNESTTLLSAGGSTTTEYTVPTTTTVTGKQTSQLVNEGDQSASRMEPGDIKHLIHVIQSTTLKPTAAKSPEVQKRPEVEEERHPPKPTPAVPEGKNEGNGSRQNGRSQEGRVPWGPGCSQPWQGHTFCTNIIMRASLASSYWKVCRGLQLYLQCLNQLLEACPWFQPFNTIGDTVDFVTSVFQHKCPEF